MNNVLICYVLRRGMPNLPSRLWRSTSLRWARSCVETRAACRRCAPARSSPVMWLRCLVSNGDLWWPLVTHSDLWWPRADLLLQWVTKSPLTSDSSRCTPPRSVLTSLSWLVNPCPSSSTLMPSPTPAPWTRYANGFNHTWSLTILNIKHNKSLIYFYYYYFDKT